MSNLGPTIEDEAEAQADAQYREKKNKEKEGRELYEKLVPGIAVTVIFAIIFIIIKLLFS